MSTVYYGDVPEMGYSDWELDTEELTQDDWFYLEVYVIPETGTLLMGLVGMAVLGVYGCYRRRKAAPHLSTEG